MPIVEQIPRWFEWADSAPFLAVHQAYQNLMESWFDEWLAKNAPDDIKYLFESFSRVDKNRRISFLLSPQTYNFLSETLGRSGYFHEQFIEQALVAEYYLCFRSVPAFSDIAQLEYWTSLGDFCVIPSSGDIFGHGKHCANLFLDGTSPYSEFDHDLGQDRTLRYDHKNLTQVYRKIENAISYLKQHAPSVEAFLTMSLRSVTVRYCMNTSSFFSGSRSSFIGKAGLVNTHTADLYDVMDALIHEAVHSFLYRIEIFEEFYNSAQDKTDVTVTSPWSHRSLKLHSFTHACFVWYALACFWSQYTDRSLEAEKKYQRAYRGFMSSDLIQPLKSYVSSDVICAVEQMQNRVRRLM